MGSITVTNNYQETYEIKSRGKCTHCPRQVWTDQPRYKNEDGTYTHIKCPCRCGGHVDQLKKYDAMFDARDKAFKQIQNGNQNVHLDESQI